MAKKSIHRGLVGFAGELAGDGILGSCAVHVNSHSAEHLALESTIMIYSKYSSCREIIILLNFYYKLVVDLLKRMQNIFLYTYFK